MIARVQHGKQEGDHLTSIVESEGKIMRDKLAILSEQLTLGCHKGSQQPQLWWPSIMKTIRFHSC